MTIEEKRELLSNMLQDIENIRKLIRLTLQEAIPNLPEEKLDQMIHLLTNN